jgi:hypothetical protein
MAVLIECGSELLFYIRNLTQYISVQIFSELSIHIAIFWVQRHTLVQIGANVPEEILPEFESMLHRNNGIRLERNKGLNQP